jgi:hypothetical protein
MSTDRELAVCRSGTEQLAWRAVPDPVWACGYCEDDRCCLVLEGGLLRLVYAERGETELHLEAADDHEAVQKFVEWVVEIHDRHQSEVESTRRWLEQQTRDSQET